MNITNEIQKGVRHINVLIIGNIIFYVLLFYVLKIFFIPSDNIESYLNTLWWWPWLFSVYAGLVIYYEICENKNIVKAIVYSPKYIFYIVVIFFFTVFVSWWYIPEAWENN